MNFFISNKTKTSKKFKQWFYWHDEKCKVIEKNDQVVLYYGYAIDQDLEEEILTNWDKVPNLNGSYCCCKITEHTVEVFTDYFDTSKIFYLVKDRIEISNSLKFLSLSKNDIDYHEVARRQNLPDMYTQSGEFTGGNWQNYHPFSLEEQKYKERCPSASKTVFHNVFQVQAQHKLIVDKQPQQVRIHDIHRDIQTAFQTKSNFSSLKELQEHITFRMKKHSSKIVSEYKQIACTLSEGIDSSLQNLFFPDAKQYSYHVVNPETVKLRYKKELYEKLNFKNVIIGEFDNTRSKEYAIKYAQDPTAYYFDFLPLYPLIKEAEVKPDILLVGSNADEMFMHRVDYLTSEVYELMWRKDRKTAHKKTIEWFQNNKDCYATRRNIFEEESYWSQKFSDGEESDQYWHACPNHFTEALSYKVACGLYSRHLSHELDTQVTSLYQDKSICFEIMKLPLEERIEITKDCSIQKAIMLDSFGINFQTPYKDNASYNTYPPVSVWYKTTVPYVLKKHLPEA